MKNPTSKKEIDDLSYQVIGAAIEVHKHLGPGLLESVYHRCMEEELRYRNIRFQTELSVPVVYREKRLSADLRCDLFVENCLVVELKAVMEMHKVFEAQVLSYMELLQAPKGILINFTCSNIFKKGQKTFVNEYYRMLE